MGTKLKCSCILAIIINLFCFWTQVKNIYESIRKKGIIFKSKFTKLQNKVAFVAIHTCPTSCAQ